MTDNPAADRPILLKHLARWCPSISPRGSWRRRP